MKTYIVYVGGDEVGTIKAGGQNAAEKKAQAKVKKGDFGSKYIGTPDFQVSVAYTEV
jgi:hypothetical protein